MNTVYITTRYLCFLQDFGETEKHRHDTFHVTISLQGKMHCKIDDDILDSYAYITNANIDHQRFGENADSLKLIFILEPCAEFLMLTRERLFADKNYVELTYDQYHAVLLVVKKIMNATGQTGSSEQQLDLLKSYIDQVLELCGFPMKEPLCLDDRVTYLIEKIRNAETVENDMIDRICADIGLSKSRLLHLFKETTGMSLKKYLQNIKFFKTWRYMGCGENITEACIHAGYSDSAHYSNFMSQCYGTTTKQEIASISEIYILD